MKEDILNELQESAEVLNSFLDDEEQLGNIEKAATLLVNAFKNGNKAISCGNGGSHCDAMHFAEELSGRYRDGRPAIPAIAISDPSHITCVGNDYGFEFIFSRYISALGNENDVLFAISTSGNSRNILNAAEVALEKGMKIIALTGNDGGNLSRKADIEIRVPHMGYADRIQEVHIKIIHVLIMLIEKQLFNSEEDN